MSANFSSVYSGPLNSFVVRNEEEGIKMAYNNKDRDYQQREMFEATCSECGKKCEVPFKPIDGRPIFCRDCYSKKKGYKNNYNN